VSLSELLFWARHTRKLDVAHAVIEHYPSKGQSPYVPQAEQITIKARECSPRYTIPENAAEKAAVALSNAMRVSVTSFTDAVEVERNDDGAAHPTYVARFPGSDVLFSA
jgi:hypothetical protein